MKKWQYEIIVQMKDGTEYLVWTYSKHFDEIEYPTRKQKRIMRKVGAYDSSGFHAIMHCYTAIEWVNGIWKDIEHKREDRVKEGKFNPHYRINTDDVWVEIKDIREIYFKMHLLNQGEQPT